ncbi:M48_yhfN_like domain containing protein [Acidimicrobiia bacterium]
MTNSRSPNRSDLALTAPQPNPLPVEVVYSRRRRKTVQATVVDGVIRIQAPAGIPRAELDGHIDDLVARLSRRYQADTVDLAARAAKLARRFKFPQPTHVRWAEQRTQWGSCTPSTGEIRISTRLAQWPPWVLDYVLVHELAHLVELNHSAAFHQLVDQYPLAERARGFLIAKSITESDTDSTTYPDADTDTDTDTDETEPTSDTLF